MYTCESWTIKKAEGRRIDAFKLWFWRQLLRVPWMARRSNQSILNIHWKDWCWNWSSNTLATWCEEPTHGKDPDAGKDWRQEEKGAIEDEIVGWHHRFSGHKFEQTLGDSEGQGSLACCNPWSRKVSDMTEQLTNKKCFGRINLLASCRSVLQKYTSPHTGVRFLKTNICNVFLYSCWINIVIYWKITGKKNESGKPKCMLAKVSPKAPVKAFNK